MNIGKTSSSWVLIMILLFTITLKISVDLIEAKLLTDLTNNQKSIIMKKCNKISSYNLLLKNEKYSRKNFNKGKERLKSAKREKWIISKKCSKITEKTNKKWKNSIIWNNLNFKAILKKWTMTGKWQDRSRRMSKRKESDNSLKLKKKFSIKW